MPRTPSFSATGRSEWNHLTKSQPIVLQTPCRSMRPDVPATGTLATGASFRGTEDPQPSKIDLDFYRSPLCHANHSTSGWPALMDRRTHYESLNGSIALET